MSATIAVTRTDHTPESLCKLASSHKYRDCRHRLRALALMMEDTVSRAERARRIGVDVQTLRDWVVRYNEVGVDGLRDAPRSGRPPKLDACQEAQLVAWMDAGPDPDAGEPSCRTVDDVRHWIMHRMGVDFTLEGVRRMIRRLGFRHVSPRPIHPRAKPEDQALFRENFKALAAAALPDDVSGEDVCVFFQDEARIGQKGMVSRVWARKGTRARIPRDHRYGYVYLFSAACPETGVAVGHVCDKANTTEMNRHLRDVSSSLDDGKHALIVLDGAGWHRSKDLEIPANVSLLRLPPYSPELNPIETLFSVLKHRRFANRVFESTEHVRKTVTEVWETFSRNAKNISQITTREWATL